MKMLCNWKGNLEKTEKVEYLRRMSVLRRPRRFLGFSAVGARDHGEGEKSRAFPCAFACQPPKIPRRVWVRGGRPFVPQNFHFIRWFNFHFSRLNRTFWLNGKRPLCAIRQMGNQVKDEQSLKGLCHGFLASL